MMDTDIYSYIKTQENEYETEEIQVGENWYWNMRRHIQMIFHLKNGVFFTGENNWIRAFKNIMEPMLNLSYWTEDIEVKDAVFFIEGKNDRSLSFLIKKYHDEVYVKEHDLDMLFDEITESDLDYGGVLVQKGKNRPEVLPLNTVAFCDQTDILGNPIAFKHYFAPEALRKMANAGWGEESNGATISIEELITLATADKEAEGTLNEKKNRVPGKTVEVYVVRGTFPGYYLDESEDMDSYSTQLHIVAFYTDKKGNKNGVTLYKKESDGDDILFFTSKKVHGRALGRGVGEALIHPQIWTNFLTIHKMNMLEAASKVPLVTDDERFADRNIIQDMENLEITTVADGKTISQIPTAAPANIALYENSINEWFEHSQTLASAFDPILGKEPVSGTTFRGQERTVAQGRGIHERRRGQRAKFIELIYRKWIIPDIVKEINKGKEFLANLSFEEMQWVSDQLAEKHAARAQVADILRGAEEVANGKPARPLQDKEFYKRQFKEQFSKNGSRHLLKTLKNEFKDIEVKMGINIAGKQKDLALLSDKLLSIFQFVFANPQGFQQAMQIPALSRSFQDILEFSGLSQADFLTLVQPPQALAPQGAPQQQVQQPVESAQPAISLNQQQA